MKSLKTVRREANGIARAVKGLLGQRSLQRVVCEHLEFFAGLRTGGATWDQIATLMASEGLRTRKGGDVSADVLRALYSRALLAAPTGRLSCPVQTSNTRTREHETSVVPSVAGPDTSTDLIQNTVSRVRRSSNRSPVAGSGPTRAQSQTPSATKVAGDSVVASRLDRALRMRVKTKDED